MTPTPRARVTNAHAAAFSGKYEDQAIIGQAEAFMSIHAHGMRFSDWDTHYTNHDHAGYRKQAGGDVEYWINTPKRTAGSPHASQTAFLPSSHTNPHKSTNPT